MSKFPSAIPIPEDVDQARKTRQRQISSAGWFGIVCRLCVIAFELLGSWYYQSSVLFVDAVGTLADVFTTLILLLCITLAAKPPDKNHPFGHGRYEPLAGLQLGILLLFTGGWLTLTQGITLWQHKVHYFIDHAAWIIPFLAAILLHLAACRAKNTAQQQDCSALLAEANHLKIDAWNSLFATFMLAIGTQLHSYAGLLDTLGAFLIAFTMILAGFFSARENIHQIMDRTPSDSYFIKVRKAAKSVPGVLDTEKVRIMRYGPDAHVDIDIEVDPSMRVDDAHKISQQVRVAIQRAWPDVRDATVHIEPFYPGDHDG